MTYGSEINRLVASGKTQIEATQIVDRTRPDLRRAALQEAAQRRNAQRLQGSRVALPASPATAETPDVNAMLSAAINGQYFSEHEIAAATKPIHKTNAWFRHEVEHRRQNLRDEEQERQERSTPPVRQPSRARTAEPFADHDGLLFVLPSTQAEFELMCRDPGSCVCR